ncbi:MAG: S41 family peptidase [Chromatiales bacterium]
MSTPLLAQTEAENGPDIDVSSELPLEDLRIFSQIFGRIKKDYVEEVDDKKLIEDAIRGMLSGLDPHSTYLNAEDFKNLKVGTSGEFGGLGIEVGTEDGFIKVIAPIDDTPADRAGIMAGDLISRIDGKAVKGMSLDDSVKMMRGKPGTEIILTILRKTEDKPLEITIVRDIIKVASVKQRILEDNLGYVRISQFQSRTAEDLLKAISRLKRKSGGKLKGVVLDLRNNPGGVLSAAVSVSDAFLEEGLIVYTKGMASDSKMEFKAAPDDIVDGAPLVVLVNGGSASASEIVAGALQDHRRAVIMGQPTFGKGSVQTIVPITDSIAVKLTTARYYTPSGRSIQAEGIEPDILLDEVKIASLEHVGRVKEADLAGHLENGDAMPEEHKSESRKETKSLAEEDYELSAALNLLKGLVLYESKSN